MCEVLEECFSRGGVCSWETQWASRCKPRVGRQHRCESHWTLGWGFVFAFSCFFSFVSSRCEIWKLYSVTSGGSPWVRKSLCSRMHFSSPASKSYFVYDCFPGTNWDWLSTTVAHPIPTPSSVLQAKPVFLLKTVLCHLSKTLKEVVGTHSLWAIPAPGSAHRFGVRRVVEGRQLSFH